MTLVYLLITAVELLAVFQMTPNVASAYYHSALSGKYNISYINDVPTNGSFEQEGYINCSCDGQSRTTEIPKDYLDEIFSDLVGHRTCGEHFTDEMCDLLRNCSRCNTEIWLCKTNLDKKDVQDCVKKQYRSPDHRENIKGAYRRSVTENRLRFLSKLLSRNRRGAVGKCFYPSYVKTSDVICLQSEDTDSVKCQQKCLFGHTFEEGISRVLTCNPLEGVWKPRGFEECRPFIDCNLSLKSSGFLSCETGTSVQAPSCNVTCHRYEDRSEVQRKVQCRIYGGWSKRLPFCVTRAKNIELVKPPLVKLHSLSYDPYFRKTETN